MNNNNNNVNNNNVNQTLYNKLNEDDLEKYAIAFYGALYSVLIKHAFNCYPIKHLVYRKLQYIWI